MLTNMRKINKSCDLSTAYRFWEADLEARNLVHPKYNSSKGKYYMDVKMQLLRCQKGLCANTEKHLCDAEQYAAKHWHNGRYNSANMGEGISGSLDHFDEKLKSKPTDLFGRKDWLWRNFFVVDLEINNKKGTQVTDEIMKPDRSDFDSFLLMEYNLDKHLFQPKLDLSGEISERVKRMIDVLGINRVWYLRKQYFKEKLELIYSEIKTWDSVAISQFPTAFQMIRKEYEGRELDLIEFF